MIKSTQQLLEEASKVTRCKTPDEAVVAYLDSGNGLLIDVREPPELANGVIDGAVPIPRGILEMQIVKLTTDEEIPIFLFCGSGARAVLAARTLQEMGYRDVTAILGSPGAIDQALRLGKGK